MPAVRTGTRGAVITGWGTALPPKILTNADLEQMMDTNDQWIVERTGIRERHVGGTTADLSIESARRLPGVAPLSPAQIHALDLFDELANDPVLNLMMELEPGDMQFVHNHTILHDRTAFEDFPEPERKRHLLRLWVAPANARPLPEVYAERFGSIEPGSRGGVEVAGSTATIVFG